MTTPDPTVLREAFGQFPTGVTVVTAVADDGTPVGFTANSFSSVSLDPPLLLVCPGRSMSCFSVFETCRHFAVNVLAEGQQDISNKFSRYQGDQFSEISWRQDATRLPLIDGAAVQFSCTTHKAVDAGDHIILIGAIDTVVSSERLGLVFVSGGYLSLGHEREATKRLKNSKPIRVGRTSPRSPILKETIMSTLQYFRGPFIVTIIVLVLAYYLGWKTTGTMAGAMPFLLIGVVLSILEISLSFDNAVVINKRHL